MSDYPPEQYQQMPPQRPQDPPGKGMATASMVLGIIALVFAWFGYAALISVALSIVGIVLAVNAKKKNAEVGAPPGVATAGLVCSIIALGISLLVFVACTLCVAGLAGAGALNSLIN